MSLQDNKAVVRHFIEEMRRGNDAIFDQHPGMVEVKENLLRGRDAAAEGKIEIVLQFGEGEWVATRLFISGTNKESGQPIGYEVLQFNRIVDGSIVEQHSQADMGALMQSMGIPNPMSRQ